MKNNLFTFLYIAIWGGLMVYVGDTVFPNLFGDKVMPTTKEFWINMYTYFNAGGTIGWSLVFSLLIWILITSFGAITLLMTGPSIIPALQKYRHLNRRAMPKKRKVQYPSC